MNAEQAIIGAVLIDPEKFTDVADLVSVEDFADQHNRSIWSAMCKLDSQGKHLDLVTLVAETKEAAYLHDLYKSTPSSANIVVYAGMVRDKSLERKLLAAGSEVMEIAKGQGDIADRIDRAVTRLMSLSGSDNASGPTSVKSLLPAWVDMMESRLSHAGELLGVSTGLVDLDRKTAGLQKTDLIIVAGRPSMGKTTLAMNIAEQVAVRDQGNVLVFSMEMSAEQLITRSVASLNGVNQNRLRLADLNDEEWKKTSNSTAMLQQSGLLIDETPGLTISALRTRAKRQHKRTPLDLIVVDYIQLMAGKGENQNLIVSDISRGLKALAKELSVPVVALSQLNRQVDQRADKRPVMSDLRDSGAIEQDADLILFVYRDEVYNPDTANPGLAEVNVAKQRNGEAGKVQTLFQGQYCRFRNWIGEVVEDIPCDRWRGGFEG